MATRTNATAVKQILPADSSVEDAVIDAFIADANQVVTEVLGSDTSLSSTQKTMIEKWLAAHYIASTVERQARREGADGANITYAGKSGMGLDTTTYGQQVKVLDTTGKMAKIGKKRATVYAIPATNKNRLN
jgi:hypothetical protein